MQQKKTFLFCWLGLILLGVVGNGGSLATAAPKLSTLNKTWEAYMGNNLMLAYYSLGLLGDLYRTKIYNQARAKDCLIMIKGQLKREKAFLATIKVRGSRNKALFRKIRAYIETAFDTWKALHRYISTKEKSFLTKFATFRNEMATQVQQVLSHPAASKTRHYPGGLRGGVERLGHYLGMDLAYGYLLLGMIADGYFRQMLSKSSARQYLIPTGRLLQSGFRHLKDLSTMVNPADRSYISRLGYTAKSLVSQATALNNFIKTRQRSFVKKYQKHRQAAWSRLSLLGAP